MKFFTGWEYLLIDVANQWGLDKKLFEERIQWTTDNLSVLEDLGRKRMEDEAALPNDQKWKEAPLYFAAVLAVRKAQKGLPSGHLVGLDACCSGMQVMSAMTGCVSGSRATGMVDKGVRADAYTIVTDAMGQLLANPLAVNRKDAKSAVMTSFYGSKATPKRIFGEGTPELEAFYEAMQQVAPGAWELLQVLLASWQPYALAHSWKLPDGFDAVIKVMTKREVRIEVDELNHSTFSYEFDENIGQEKGLSNVANVTHSMDAWVLRSMQRRCNYDREVAVKAAAAIDAELMARKFGVKRELEQAPKRIAYYIEQYKRSTIADVVILPYLDERTVQHLDDEHLSKLHKIIEGMLQYKPFPLITVHDEFKAHPNNLNWVRWQYKQILADVAESNVLDDILSQIYGMPGTFDKHSFNLAEQIRESEYALS
ncbi:DNA-directed RNA polymerase [Xenophilus sp. Marseille-Q4582]|uniref:DNA-directed RNA polymerase n=1 Tax=Xenophilus sp. Marseille-Q4582 TaxID=2866600 RepID=UPI001CE46B7D|nr:DNA-directed RNA polymerase [Xenophilus sp. Marseille-Q4582]